jgi:ribosomal protein L33
MWRSKDKNEDASRIEQTYCPVCKAYFGKRDCEIIFMAHCEECRATFYWRPWTEKPTVTMDKNKPVRCGCNGCGR